MGLLERCTASGTARVHLSAHAVQCQVLRTPIPVGAGLAKIGQRRHEQLGIDQTQIGIVEPECRHHPRVKIFYHHVRFRHQPHEQLPTTQQFEIKRDTLLVGIEVQEEPTLFRMRHVIWKGTKPAAWVAAVRAFDLDHTRAIIGQKLGAVGTSNIVRQIEHQDIVEGLRRHNSLRFMTLV